MLQFKDLRSGNPVYILDRSGDMNISMAHAATDASMPHIDYNSTQMNLQRPNQMIVEVNIDIDGKTQQFVIPEDATVTVTSDNPSRTYVSFVMLNGRKADGMAIRFSEILNGRTLAFKTCDSPSSFGVEPVLVTSIDPEFRYDAHFGKPVEDSFVPTMKAVTLTEFHDAYSAGGAAGLVDGKHGKINWRAGKWQGYRHNDVDVILDLLGTREISSVSAEFLQDMENYIWMPKDMEVYVSSDGKDFRLVGTRLSDVAIDDPVVRIADWKVEFEPVEAAFVRVVAHHFGEIPSWHRGYGDKGFTFIDEITVD